MLSKKIPNYEKKVKIDTIQYIASDKDIDSTIEHSERLIKEGLHGTIFFGSPGCAQLISS